MAHFSSIVMTASLIAIFSQVYGQGGATSPYSDELAAIIMP